MSDFHQTLMDEACTLWREKHLNKEYSEFFPELDPIHKEALALGALNYQVENGGFGQWHDNGYSKRGSFLLKTLQEMESQCPLASTVRKLVEEAFKNIRRVKELDPYEDEEEIQELLEMDALCDAYYEINTLWLVQVELYLRRKAGEEIPEEFLAENKEALEFKGGGISEETVSSKPVVKLIREDGNAYAIMGRVIQALKKAGFPQERIDQYMKEAQSGDYDNLLAVTSNYVEIR